MPELFPVKPMAKKSQLEFLTGTDRERCLAASKYIYDYDFSAAMAELIEISPGNRNNLNVLFVLYELYSKAGKWEKADIILNELVEIHELTHPTETLTSLAFLVERTNGTKKAKELLLKVAPKYPGDFHIPYSLACKCCKMNDLDEAERWYRIALERDWRGVKNYAIRDSDLKPLWNRMSAGMIWVKK